MVGRPPAGSRRYDTGGGTICDMAAVVLRGPANTAPEALVGPFSTLTDAEEWARGHPRPDGYSVAQALTPPDDPGLGTTA